jgi:hypothetical protein
MSDASHELVESLARFARSVSKAASREAPYVREAAGKFVRDDLPAFQRAAERTTRDLLNQFRRRPR